MSAFSSASSYTSVPANVPGCDAWGSFTVGSPGNVTLINGSGISGVTRASAGVYGISFSNPERFGGGAYVVMTTPEYSIDAGYGPVTVPPPNGRTGAGLSAGLRINTYTYPNFHPGGGTASLNDPPTGALRVNMAAFCFATERDLRSPAVLNVLKNSELFTSQWSLSAVTAPLSTDGTKAPNGSTPSVLNEGTVDGRLFVNGGTQVQRVLYQLTGNYPVSVVNKPFTASVYLKAGTRHRGRFIVYDGASTHFGVWFDLQTKTILGTSNTAAANLAILSSSSITDVGGGWFRLVISGYFANSPSNPPNGNNTGVYLNIGDETGGSSPGLYYIGENKFFYVWGTQLEEGSVVTPYIKTESTGFVLGNQDARRSLVPGAQGFGVTGATYSSARTNLLSTRTATAYGTIVIPANKANSSSVSAYIENGFNVKSVTAGGNSRYDVSFVRPMTNNTYCVILSGEYESTDTTAGVDEFALLLVRAGTGNKYKTTNGFRVEELRQYTLDNSWIEQSVRYQKGFTQRIHFMVFGGATYGQP